MISENLVKYFATIVGSEHVLTGSEQLRPYESDGLTAYREVPELVLLPGSVDEVAAIVRLCHEHRVPVIARGAGTGLSGGALPSAGAVILGLSRLNRILEIDAARSTATVQPGVTNKGISDAVAGMGLFYAPDPSSQIACSIGGNVAENSGGVHCLKYGLTVNNVQKIRIVTIEGELMEIGSDALDSQGPDLLAVMHGSEGLLGIIVEVTVRLRKLPDCIYVLLADFNEITEAGKAVSDIIESGVVPAGLELMDNFAIRAAEDFVHAGYPTDAGAILLCELDGSEEDIRRQITIIEEVFENNNVKSIRKAKTAADREILWKGRKSAFPAVGRLSPDYYCMDGTIPRKHLPSVLEKMSALSEEYDLRIANVFHAGDGNLHPLILYDANNEGELDRTEELGGKILELCIEHGGTITGEHGVGMEKLNQMCVQFSTEELQQLHRLKAAFDPLTLLNPGKAVPSLHRCAEFGAMHVHNGELPFPELERF